MTTQRINYNGPHHLKYRVMTVWVHQIIRKRRQSVEMLFITMHLAPIFSHIGENKVGIHALNIVIDIDLIFSRIMSKEITKEEKTECGCGNHIFKEIQRG